MTHHLVERLHDDEKQLQAILEGALLQYSVLLGLLLLCLLVGLGFLFLQP